MERNGRGIHLQHGQRLGHGPLLEWTVQTHAGIVHQDGDLNTHNAHTYIHTYIHTHTHTMLIVTLWSRSRRLSSSTSEKTLSAWVRSLTTTCMSALCCVDMTCLPSPASCVISEMSCVAGEWEWEWECMYWAAWLSCMAREAAAQSSAWVASPAPSGSASWSAPLEEIGGPPNPAKYKYGRSGQVRSGQVRSCLLPPPASSLPRPPWSALATDCCERRAARPRCGPPE